MTFLKKNPQRGEHLMISVDDNNEIDIDCTFCDVVTLLKLYRQNAIYTTNWIHHNDKQQQTMSVVTKFR